MEQPLRLLTDLGLNIALLLSFVLLYSWVRPLLGRVHPRLQGILSGAMFGALAVVSMNAPVHISPGITIDGRVILVALAGCFGGLETVAVAGTVATAYRLYVGGAGAVAGACTIAAVMAIGALFHSWYIGRGRPIDATVLLLLGVITAAVGIAMTFLLPRDLIWPTLRAFTLPVVVGYPLGSLLLGSLLLLERRKHEAERALASEKEQLRAILDNATTLIYVKDLEGRHLVVNQTLAKVLRMPPEQIVGKTNHDLFPGSEADTLSGSDRGVLTTGASIEHEEILELDDGPHTYLSCKVPLCDARGIPYAVCGISTDITERKRIEEERGQLLLKTQEALRVRDTFLSIASHELQTPLTSLQLLIQRLVRTFSCEGGPRDNVASIRQQLLRAERQTRRLGELIDELLDLSRMGAEGIRLRLEEVDLGEVVRDVVERYRDHLDAARCDVLLEGERHLLGLWDRVRVDQIATNLLGNAAKFGAGSPIEIVLSEEPSFAVLTVRDHGIGVAVRDRERIFDKFERAVSHRNYGGLGLGLYITRQIVEAHGGTVSADGGINRGATFTVKLPRACRSRESTSRASAALNGGSGAC